MNGSPTSHWRLPWPVVPPRLWGTAGATVVAIVSLVFNHEIWPQHPQARQWSWLALAVLLRVAAGQVIAVLWAWPRAFVGPAWMRLLLRAAVLAAVVGIAVVQVWLLCIGCFLLVKS